MGSCGQSSERWNLVLPGKSALLVGPELTGSHVSWAAVSGAKSSPTWARRSYGVLLVEILESPVVSKLSKWASCTPFNGKTKFYCSSLLQRIYLYSSQTRRQETNLKSVFPNKGFKQALKFIFINSDLGRWNWIILELNYLKWGMGKGKTKYKEISLLLDLIEFDWSKLHIPCGVVFPFHLGNSSHTPSFKNGPPKDQVFTCEFPSSVNFGSGWTLEVRLGHSTANCADSGELDWFQPVSAGLGCHLRLAWGNESLPIIQVTFKNLVS